MCDYLLLGLFTMPIEKKRIETMKKITALLTYIAFTAGCFLYNPKVSENVKVSNTKQLVSHLQESSVALVQKSSEKKYSAYCTGVWIRKNVILTAYHCAEAGVMKPEEMIVSQLFGMSLPQETFLNRDLTFSTHKQAKRDKKFSFIKSTHVSKGKIVAVSKDRDLALIVTDDVKSRYNVSAISDDKLLAGEALHIMGHTIGLLYSYSQGTIAGERVESVVQGDEPVKLIQVSGQVWKGNSGGGAFDSKGRLVGICSFLVRGPSHISFFIHRDEITSFIKENEESLKVKKAKS